MAPVENVDRVAFAQAQDVEEVIGLLAAQLNTRAARQIVLDEQALRIEIVARQEIPSLRLRDQVCLSCPARQNGKAGRVSHPS